MGGHRARDPLIHTRAWRWQKPKIKKSRASAHVLFGITRLRYEMMCSTCEGSKLERSESRVHTNIYAQLLADARTELKNCSLSSPSTFFAKIFSLCSISQCSIYMHLFIFSYSGTKVGECELCLCVCYLFFLREFLSAHISRFSNHDCLFKESFSLAVSMDVVRIERERERGLVLCVNAKENIPERELNYLWYLSAIRQLLPSVTTRLKE